MSRFLAVSISVTLRHRTTGTFRLAYSKQQSSETWRTLAPEHNPGIVELFSKEKIEFNHR
jgi:hypothetical protein